MTPILPIRIVQFIWLLPATILCWLFYILPMWLIFRELKFVASPIGTLVAVFVLADEDSGSWYVKLWRDWGGWAGPCVVIVRRLFEPPEVFTSILAHEMDHEKWQFILGVFFYPVYLLSSVWIWLFQRHKHAYLDNPFEIAARRWAKQPVDVPRENWPQGKNDRWPWW